MKWCMYLSRCSGTWEGTCTFHGAGANLLNLVDPNFTSGARGYALLYGRMGFRVTENKGLTEHYHLSTFNALLSSPEKSLVRWG